MATAAFVFDSELERCRRELESERREHEREVSELNRCYERELANRQDPEQLRHLALYYTPFVLEGIAVASLAFLGVGWFVAVASVLFSCWHVGHRFKKWFRDPLGLGRILVVVVPALMLVAGISIAVFLASARV